MARVYMETSFISACVTDRADPVSVYRRQTSDEWWNTQAWRHDCFVSAEVIAELSHPAFACSEAALALVENTPLLPLTEEVAGLAAILVREKVMPSPTAGDALQLAVSAVHAMDYLLTWNVRHLANPNELEHLRTTCLRVAILPPRIVTPDLLWEAGDEPA